MKTVLVTGGAGYIGSHTVVELINSGYRPIVVDNFSNSSPEALKRIEQITDTRVAFYEVDLLDSASLKNIFAENTIDSVIHFAGLKAVGESVAEPLRYYENNLVSTINLLQAMEGHGVKELVFSSSATVYGDPEKVPITEEESVKPTNPYGQTKAMIEQILRDLTATNNGWSVTLLRYFNPIGAHPSGFIGEDPRGIPNNLLPFVAQVAVGKREKLSVFGGDYDTPDGTGVRDYIHVVDLAQGHLAALEHMPDENTCETFNLGTGKGSSVLEAIQAFEQASGKNIPYEIVARRPGDIATCYADPARAEQKLNWRAQHSLEKACKDTWRWQSNNPTGYKQN